MFLKPVNEKEIVDIVKKCKNKTFTDYDGINKKIVYTVSCD